MKENMTKEEYISLVKFSCLLTESEAVVMINSQFGFEASSITIIKDKRPPVYRFVDKNYIRFDVVTRCGECYYEMINGELFKCVDSKTNSVGVTRKCSL